MKITTLLISAAFASAALTIGGCGKKDDASDSGKGGTSATAPADNKGGATAGTASGAKDNGGEKTVEITANDAMKFSVTEIRAKPGQKLTVNLVNMGTMPKAAMGHNWILLKQGVEADKFAMEAATAMNTDYIPQNRQNDIIAHTKLLGPKQSDSVTFQAPSEPGRYVFLCSFPAHYQSGMKGELIVE